MRIAALTMVYRDHWALGQWIDHHARLIGRENLFILSHGPDAVIADMARGANLMTLPRDALDHFDRRRDTILNGQIASLLGVYDAVIRLDADELICTDLPLPDLLAAQADAPVLTALGLDLIEGPDDPPADDSPVLGQRRHAVFTGHYSKACIARAPVEFTLHGTRVRPRRIDDFPFLLPRGLYLVHLKYANRQAMQVANRTRTDIAGGEADGLPGWAWKHAEADAAKFFRMFEEREEKDWPAARDEAFDALSANPQRNPKTNLVRAQNLRFATRTRLPIGFGGA